MATTSCFSLLLLLLLLTAGANAGRPSPASDNAGKKQKECFEGDGGANLAGFGVPNTAGFGGPNTAGGGGFPTGTGSTDATGGIPSFTDLDHSGPAAASSRYIPGFDDTFVPNPGYEIPTSSGAVTAP
ncbi:hypothetical protein KSP39_PZI009277 [Platanthera zijinensis]|uniref:Uncharacterized protein n=1 Tax=Platanthera zijinensis TaxID=2320716 RepID=A0AAP0BL19_9ASPA